MIPTYDGTPYRVSYVRAILKAFGIDSSPCVGKELWVADGTNECIGWENRERDMTFATSI
jgi:hypothetical protein